jgi:hypothetical protein
MVWRNQVTLLPRRLALPENVHISNWCGKGFCPFGQSLLNFRAGWLRLPCQEIV